MNGQVRLTGLFVALSAKLLIGTGTGRNDRVRGSTKRERVGIC